jgi:hypothetical protein
MHARALMHARARGRAHVTCRGVPLFSSGPAHAGPTGPGRAAIAFPPSPFPVVVRGDVTIALGWHPGGGGGGGGRGEAVGWVSLHTAFLRGTCHRFDPDEGGAGGGVVTWEKGDVDAAHLDTDHRRLRPGFRPAPDPSPIRHPTRPGPARPGPAHRRRRTATRPDPRPRAQQQAQHAQQHARCTRNAADAARAQRPGPARPGPVHRRRRTATRHARLPKAQHAQHAAPAAPAAQA